MAARELRVKVEKTLTRVREARRITQPKKPPQTRKDENELAFDTVRAMLGEVPRPEPPGTREKQPKAVRPGMRKNGKPRSS